MLIKAADFLKPTNALKKKYNGVVISNADPKSLGRIKVNILGLIEGTVDTLPWCYPINGIFGTFKVPDLNSEVVIEFPFEDPYAPFYGGSWESTNTHDGLFNEDYPNSYGYRDSQNTWFKVNKSKQYAEFKHTSGSRFRMNKDGSIEIRSKKGINFLSEDGKTSLNFDLENGSISLAPKEDYNISGNKTNITSNEVNINTGLISERITGSKESKIDGGCKVVVGGSNSESILSGKAVSVGGDSSTLIAGKSSETLGLGKKKVVVLGDDETKIMVGNFIVDVIAGKINISTLAGSATIGNAIAKLEISLTGAVKLSNPMGSIEIDLSGAIKMKNNIGKVEISPAGQVEINGVMAKISGQSITEVGGNGLTNINGSAIILGGGGPPVARVGDICIGMGNQGAPVVSNIIAGSTKVLCG